MAELLQRDGKEERGLAEENPYEKHDVFPRGKRMRQMSPISRT